MAHASAPEVLRPPSAFAPTRLGHGAVRITRQLNPGANRFLVDVLDGLSRPRKAIPPKYFYDRRGSQLFEAICKLPEYYPTRTEMAIMRDVAQEIARLVGPDIDLLELGSGASLKTRLLIEHARPARYVPVDISESALRTAAESLVATFPWLVVDGVVADFSKAFELPESPIPARRTVAYFPGSTIGNFTPGDALTFLARLRARIGEDGMLVIGVDTRKDPRILELAYDDAQGVTAEFNLNLLRRINNELAGDFDLTAFRHRAFYDEGAGRIEMHLQSIEPQSVHVGRYAFHFAQGETLHTEISCKYAVEEFVQLARAAGFTPVAVWCDPRRWFSVHLLK